MTEAEWLACADPIKMQSLFDPSVCNRQLRLFACACCRRLWPELDAPVRRIVEVLEGYADRQNTATELEAITADAGASISRAFSRSWRIAKAAQAVCECTDPLAGLAAQQAARRARAAVRTGGEIDTGVRQEAVAQTALFRDIFGNPFRSVTFSLDWRTTTAVAVASQMYESRDFGAMPILADALQDAGCDSEVVLKHCRDPKQVHVRGCWVVDLVLGKE